MNPEAGCMADDAFSFHLEATEDSARAGTLQYSSRASRNPCLYARRYTGDRKNSDSG